MVANQIALAVANAKLYTQTRELSVRDELTRIYNRRHFQHVMQMEWKRATRFRRPLSLIMIDIDHFKAYNDAFGHGEGDGCLRTVAQLIRSCLRRSGDFVARYGGEIIKDFSLILLIGVIVGTYSSIFIASPTVLLWQGKGIKLRK